MATHKPTGERKSEDKRTQKFTHAGHSPTAGLVMAAPNNLKQIKSKYTKKNTIKDMYQRESNQVRTQYNSEHKTQCTKTIGAPYGKMGAGRHKKSAHRGLVSGTHQRASLLMHTKCSITPGISKKKLKTVKS